MIGRTNGSARQEPRDRVDGGDVQLLYPAEALADMEPLVKPLALGYLRADLVSDVNHALEGMCVLANANGYELEEALVFVDRDSTAGEFAALRHEIARTEARAVFSPSPQHLTSSQIEWLRRSGAGVWAAESRTCWPATALPVHEASSVMRSPSGGASGLPDESTNEAQRCADRLIDGFRRDHQSNGCQGTRSHLPPPSPDDR